MNTSDHLLKPWEHRLHNLVLYLLSISNVVHPVTAIKESPAV